MVSIGDLLAVLPEYNHSQRIIVKEQDVPDIMAEIGESHRYYAGDYDTIAKYFWTGNIYDTCRALWFFCKDNIRYEVEPTKDQTTRRPSGILTLQKGDCKHYATFIAGVLDAINRKYDAGIEWAYCFAGYEGKNDPPQHVFVIARDDEGDIWIDPVLNSFDERLQPKRKLLKKVNMLSRMSGINNDLYNVQYQQIGVIPWTDVAGSALKIVESFFGDKVPNYPIKEPKTFNSLKNSLLNDHVGTVAPGGKFEVVPGSIEQAQQWLAKAIKRKGEEEAMGHGYGDGPGWDTLQMLYDETIQALEIFIEAGGAVASGATPPIDRTAADQWDDNTTKTKSSNLLPIALLGGGALLLMMMNKGKRVSGVKNNKVLLLGGGALLLFLLMKKKKTGGVKDEPVIVEADSAAAATIVNEGDVFPQVFVREAINEQVASGGLTSDYGANTIEEYVKPKPISDPLDLVYTKEELWHAGQ